MKHLKKFNEEVESFDNIIPDIMNMSLDIKDEDPNYTVNVFSNTKDVNWRQSRLCIDIFYGDDNIIIPNDELYNFLERVDKYLIDSGFKANGIGYSYVDNEHDVDSDQHYTKFKDMRALINKIDDEIEDIDSIRLTYIPNRKLI